MQDKNSILFRFVHETDSNLKSLEFSDEALSLSDLKILIAKASGFEREFARTFDLKVFLQVTDRDSLTELTIDSSQISAGSKIIVQRIAWRERPTIEYVPKPTVRRPFPAEYLCPLCRKILCHPVVLRCASKCGQSACRDCVERHFKEHGRTCPFCAGKVQHVIPNKILSVIVSDLVLNDFWFVDEESGLAKASSTQAQTEAIIEPELTHEPEAPESTINQLSPVASPVTPSPEPAAYVLDTEGLVSSKELPILDEKIEIPPEDSISLERGRDDERSSSPPPFWPKTAPKLTKKPPIISPGGSATGQGSQYEFDPVTNSWKAIQFRSAPVALKGTASYQCPFKTTQELACLFPKLSSKDFYIVRELQRQIKLIEGQNDNRASSSEFSLMYSRTGRVYKPKSFGVRFSGGSAKPGWHVDRLQKWGPEIPDKQYFWDHPTYTGFTLWIRGYRPYVEKIGKDCWFTIKRCNSKLFHPLKNTFINHNPDVRLDLKYLEGLEEAKELEEADFWASESEDLDKRVQLYATNHERLNRLWDTVLAEALEAENPEEGLKVLFSHLDPEEKAMNMELPILPPITWRFNMIPYGDENATTFQVPSHEQPHRAFALNFAYNNLAYDWGDYINRKDNKNSLMRPSRMMFTDAIIPPTK